MVHDDMVRTAVDETETTLVAPAPATGDVTQILSRIERGDPQAAGQLLPLVYDELRKLAAAKMAQEKPGQTLQATALVHEAYIRLVDSENKASTGNGGDISLRRRLRRCAASWSRTHAARSG